MALLACISYMLSTNILILNESIPSLKSILMTDLSVNIYLLLLVSMYALGILTDAHTRTHAHKHPNAHLPDVALIFYQHCSYAYRIKVYYQPNGSLISLNKKFSLKQICSKKVWEFPIPAHLAKQGKHS